jgi:hypothetical protein
LWGATKALIDAVFVLMVLAVLEVVPSWWGMLIPFVLTLSDIWEAAVTLAVTMRIQEIDHYNFFFAVVFSCLWIPGAYFPLEICRWQCNGWCG